jgi:hypothetical protein
MVPVAARPLSRIAQDIREGWPRPYYGAEPYIEAMGRLDKITDRYGMETAEGIVRHFLANAGTWRGEAARRVKKELKGLLDRR